jgi:hypothetical protein
MGRLFGLDARSGPDQDAAPCPCCSPGRRWGAADLALRADDPRGSRGNAADVMHTARYRMPSVARGSHADSRSPACMAAGCSLSNASSAWQYALRPHAAKFVPVLVPLLANAGKTIICPKWCAGPVSLHRCGTGIRHVYRLQKMPVLTPPEDARSLRPLAPLDLLA